MTLFAVFDLYTHFSHAVVLEKIGGLTRKEEKEAKMEVIFDYLLVVWLQRPIATIYFSDVYANSSAAGGFISITERSIAPSFFCCAGASFIFLSICNIECRKYNSLFTRLFLSADRKHSQTLSLTYSFYDFYVDLLNTSCLSASQALLTPNVVPRF